MSRTAQQNRALHKYFSLLAEELNEHGFETKTVLCRKRNDMVAELLCKLVGAANRAIKKLTEGDEIDIPWSGATVKELLWKPVQLAMYADMVSTTQLGTNDVDEVYTVLSRHISQHFGVHVEFPHNAE